jgi:hypothetical protein
MSTSLGLLTGAITSLLDPQEVAQPRYQPTVETTWQIQLQGATNTGYQADLYILDLFDTPQSVITDLQASGRKVICYFSAGTYEEWREDEGRFTAADKGGQLDNWPGERWLNTRSTNVRSIMVDRLTLAAEKGCDGVDPDNVDGYSNQTGFPLTYDSQLDYNRFLFNQAQSMGLAVSLKNDVEQVADLIDYVDFAVNESCHEWQECHRLLPFVEAGKPVFHIDYIYSQDPDGQAIHCQHMGSLGYRSLTLPVALDDSYRFSCD